MSTPALTPDQFMAQHQAPPAALTPDQFMARQFTAPKEEPSASSRLLDNFLSGLGVTSNEDAKNFFEHPINTFMGSLKAQGELAKKAKDAYDRGDYKSAVIHGLNYLVPFIGQQTDKAGEQLSQGDIAGGVGRTLGVAVPIVAGSPEARAAAGKVASAAGTAAKVTGQVIKDTATPENIATAAGGFAGAKLGALAGEPFGGGAAGAAVGRVIGKSVAKRLATPAAEAEAAAEAPAAAAAPKTLQDLSNTAPAPKTTPKAVEAQLEQSLGGQKLVPGVSLKNQPAAMAAAAGKLPEGFTPVESSVLKGYKYDPAAQEFEAITNNGQRYRAGEVTPEQYQKFLDADSKGAAWNELRSNSTPLGKYVGGKFEPYKRAGLRSADPEDALEAKQRNLSDFIEKPAKKTAGSAKAKTLKDLSGEGAAPKAEEDLTSLLQQSVAQVKSGVSTMASPADLAKRWGVDAESLASGREQTRGMSAEQTEEYISKLADAYKNGRAVDPVIETRDADNNIIEVDGRARAIAAQRAGIKRIPIIVRRAKVPTP